MTIEQFSLELEKIGIEINEDQLNKFQIYYETLVEWNEKINLTAIVEKEDVYEKHFYDCLLASQVYDFNDQSICDIGAGAGFPSIPLKIIFPNLKVTIVDSLEKRIKFLNHLADKLQLSDFSAVAQRAEEHAVDYREHYDLVMGRAVARLNILDELCLPLVKVGGHFLALKGRQGLIEYDEARKGLESLGAIEQKIEKYNLISDDSVRYLMLYKKIKKTNIKYPRNFGQIKKKPL